MMNIAMNQNKRTFLKAATAAGAALPLFSIGKPAKSETEQLRSACIGMGYKMHYDLPGIMARTTLVAVCDVDTTRREAAQKQVNEHYQNKECAAYSDYREVLAREDVDVVFICTPDHWHAQITIDAARAGKHIYCEKPLTHDIDEAIRVMDEIKKAGIVLQTGSQQRGMKEFRVAANLIRNQVAGKVLDIKTEFWGPPRPYDLKGEEMEPGLDWNMWCGPAPFVDYNSKLAPRGVHKHWPAWRNYMDYGGGGVCDMGAHQLDIIQWALDMDNSGPVKALPQEGGRGARLVYEGGLEVERTGEKWMVDFLCENGRISATRGKFRFELDGKVIQQFEKPEDGSLDRAVVLAEREYLKDAKIRLPYQKKGGHVQNFLDAVVSGGVPVAPVNAGARSAICCHLMNLTYYKKQAMHWDPKKLTFSDKSCDPAWMTGSRRDWTS